VTKYTYGGSSVCFINNQFVDRDVKVTLGGETHLVPAWSVSILPDCKTVAYNTAKVLFLSVCLYTQYLLIDLGVH
jgi:hypothetical protein